MIRYRSAPRSARHARQRGSTAGSTCTTALPRHGAPRAEQETALYPTELRAFRRDNPPPDLKSYMLATAGQPRP